MLVLSLSEPIHCTDYIQTSFGFMLQLVGYTGRNFRGSNRGRLVQTSASDARDHHGTFEPKF
jgi:hypothetical protein